MTVHVRTGVAFADAFVAGAPDPSTRATTRGVPVSLRGVLIHRVEEYARHNGHTDLLRERIDGATGL